MSRFSPFTRQREGETLSGAAAGGGEEGGPPPPPGAPRRWGDRGRDGGREHGHHAHPLRRLPGADPPPALPTGFPGVSREDRGGDRFPGRLFRPVAPFPIPWGVRRRRHRGGGPRLRDAPGGGRLPPLRRGDERRGGTR